MKAKHNIFTTYGSYLIAGRDMRDALQAHLVRNKLPADIVAGLASVHATHYGAHATKLETGAYRFFMSADDTTSANRHESATKQWNRVIAPYIGVKDKRGGKRNKAEPLSPVDKLVASYDKLTATERKQFRRLAGIE